MVTYRRYSKQTKQHQRALTSSRTKHKANPFFLQPFNCSELQRINSVISPASVINSMISPDSVINSEISSASLINSVTSPASVINSVISSTSVIRTTSVIKASQPFGDQLATKVEPNWSENPEDSEGGDEFSEDEFDPVETEYENLPLERPAPEGAESEEQYDVPELLESFEEKKAVEVREEDRLDMDTSFGSSRLADMSSDSLTVPR